MQMANETMDTHVPEFASVTFTDGTALDPPGYSLTAEEIVELRSNWKIPESVEIRPLEPEDQFFAPGDGWTLCHEYQLRCGLSLPLKVEVQYLLAASNFAIGQVGPNMWRQLLGLCVMYKVLKQQMPTYHELHAMYRAEYSRKAGFSGTIQLKSKAVFKKIVEDLPSSVSRTWRERSFLIRNFQNPDYALQVPVDFQQLMSKSSPSGFLSFLRPGL